MLHRSSCRPVFFALIFALPTAGGFLIAGSAADEPRRAGLEDRDRAGSQAAIADDPAISRPNAKAIPDRKARTKRRAEQAKRQTSKGFRWVNRPAGELPAGAEHHTFESAIAGEPVGYVIYQPPQVRTDSARRVPVLYYLHGGRPGSELKSVSIARDADRLIREGAIAPLILVFVNGGPVSHYNTPADEAIGQAATQGADVFVQELIPHIDATYPTQATREGRHLTGFSQGGRGTARLAFRYPELFSTAAPGGGGYATEKRISESEGFESETLRFAPGDNAYDLARQYAAARRENRVPPVRLLVFVGTKGFNYENNVAYMAFLDDLEIPYERIVVKGAKHSAREIFDKRALELFRFHESR